jgi:hypothetical protein
MSNPNSADVQEATLKNIWKRYRAHAKTSRRLKAEQGGWRLLLLIGTIAAMLLSPFSKTLDKLGLDIVAKALTVGATLVFALTAWLHKEVLGDDSEQPWVRSRQTGEGLKALAFRFLGGVAPFNTPGAELALKQADALIDKAGISPDTVDAKEALEKIPAAPLTIDDYMKLRVDDQIKFYSEGIDDEREKNARLVKIGRSVSVAVVVFGVLSGVIAGEWRDIWAPALAAAATLAAAQNVRARHRFLIESYSNALVKLESAKTLWETSSKGPADNDRLIECVEAILTTENAGWVQQMLIKPVVPDTAPASARA